MPLFKKFWKKNDDDSSGDECEDKSADALSYVGLAAYNVLRRHHNHHHHELWNVTKGKVIGDVYVTPTDAFTRTQANDPSEGHSDWMPKKLGNIISKTEEFLDVLSLAPPDGLFLKAFKRALMEICVRRDTEVATNNALAGNRIVIRMMFGNIVGMPVNCNYIIKELTKDLPPSAPSIIKLWVGSWRKGVSWNHSKIIAVDGKYLWTGGHNFWDGHYLKNNPTVDLSIELEGSGVTNDAHRYANAQWGYIVKKQSTKWGKFVDQYVNDAVDVPITSRVTISEYPNKKNVDGTTVTLRGTAGADDSGPHKASEFPPYYKPNKALLSRRGFPNTPAFDPEYVPIITMGRYGTILKKSRPSDDAFVAMIDSAQHTVRLALQDIGPVTIPNTKSALPGCVWPAAYLEAFARVIWNKQVDVEIVLSNPGSVPGGLSKTEALYGNGWSCVDVAAEIIKSIKTQYPQACDMELRVKVQNNLRVCYVRCPNGGRTYADGKTIGLHSKHFIIDDICCYIGSQNLYICDLAEWGVVIDDAKKVEQIKAQYWDGMWKASYSRDDCLLDAVMDGLKIDRGTPDKFHLTKLQVQAAKENFNAAGGVQGVVRKKIKEKKEKIAGKEDSESNDDDSSSDSEGED